MFFSVILIVSNILLIFCFDPVTIKLYAYSSVEIQVGKSPNVIAINENTDTVYVADGIDGESDNSLESNTITIINGSSNTTTKISVPTTKISDLAVNAIQNKTYVIGYAFNSTTQDVFYLNGNNDLRKCISLNADWLEQANIDSNTNTLYLVSHVINGTSDDAETKTSLRYFDYEIGFVDY